LAELINLNKARKLRDRKHRAVDAAAQRVKHGRSKQQKQLDAEIITPVFKDWKGDKYKIISFYAKKARGLMVAYIIRNRLNDVEQIKNFDSEGYAYNPAMSSAKEWVFTREAAAN